MSRNRKPRPDKIITARMDGSIARCGDCGQRLWKVEDGQLSPVIESGARGKRFADGAWRVSSYSKRQRARTRAEVEDPNLSPDERNVNVRRLAIGAFSRAVSHEVGPSSDAMPQPTQRPTFIVAVPTAGLLETEGGNFLSGFGPRDLMGKHLGSTYRLKNARRLEQLSPDLANELRLPARVECPRCSKERPVVNIIGDA
jgi:hypothetical protein